jgi:polyferredoxin
MDKMEYPRGLIRFSTQNALTNHWTQEQVVKKILRPRVLIYTGLLLLMSAGLVYSLVTRVPFKVDIIRDRGVMSRLVAGGKVENVYQMQITNASEQVETFKISVSGIDGLSLASSKEFTVNAAETRMVAVSLQIMDGSIKSGSHPVIFEIVANGSNEHLFEKSIFYMSR